MQSQTTQALLATVDHPPTSLGLSESLDLRSSPDAYGYSPDSGKLVRSAGSSKTSFSVEPQSSEQEFYVLPLMGNLLERYLSGCGDNIEELRSYIRDISLELDVVLRRFLPEECLIEPTEDIIAYVESNGR